MSCQNFKYEEKVEEKRKEGSNTVKHHTADHQAPHRKLFSIAILNSIIITLNHYVTMQ